MEPEPSAHDAGGSVNLMLRGLLAVAGHAVVTRWVAGRPTNEEGMKGGRGRNERGEQPRGEQERHQSLFSW